MEASGLEAELRSQGFAVVKGFLDAASCRAARAAIDGYLGPHAEKAPVDKKELGHNGNSGGFTHVVSHPNPLLATVAHVLPALAEVHAASLSSDPAHMCLNGQHFIRTDPNPDAPPGAKNWHIGKCSRPLWVFCRSLKSSGCTDNCFLPVHEESRPRRVYTRSILALNKIESGGAAVMFSPGGIGAARDVVSRFVAEQGEEAYDPREWLAPLQRELIAQDAQSPSDSGRGTALAEGVGLAADVECLMEVRCS
eukprot:COSAG04_NODE_3376_length_2875_cov_1.748199_3_plen_252_part_00